MKTYGDTEDGKTVIISEVFETQIYSTFSIRSSELETIGKKDSS